MKKFIQQVFFFCILIFSLVHLPRLFTSELWGNPVLASKYSYLKDNLDSYNTLYLGSSRVHRHFDCNLLDSLFNNELNSFNYGAPATYIPEMYEAYHHLKDSHNLSGKTVFMELQSFTPVAKVNEETVRSSYFIDIDTYKFIHGYKQNEQETQAEKINLKFYIKSIFHNFFNYKGFRTQLKNVTQIENRVNYELTKGFDGRINNVKRDRDLPIKKYDKLQKQHKFFSRIGKVNLFHLEYIQELLKEAEKKEINLIFMLLPSNFQNLLTISKSIPPENLIDLSNPNFNIELYKRKYYFDHGHFNASGAKIFSKLFHKKCIEKKLMN